VYRGDDPPDRCEEMAGEVEIDVAGKWFEQFKVFVSLLHGVRSE
jgi:hypothetical protein